MTGLPSWRTPYDLTERLVAPPAEKVVRSDRFASVAATVFGIRRAVEDGVTGLAARVWHLVNLPAGSDLQRLHAQIGALDREVRRLTLHLEQRGDHGDRAGSEQR